MSRMMKSNLLNDLLHDFIKREGVIAAALIGMDGMVIDSASRENIDMDRISALLGIFVSNTRVDSQKIRVLKLPQREIASYVLLGIVSGAILALLTTNDNSTQKICDSVNKDLFRVRLALATD